MTNEQAQTLTARFRNTVLTMKAALERTGPSTHNTLYDDELLPTYRQIRSDKLSEAFFLELLHDDSPEVQGWCAAMALEFAPEAAEATLVRLEAGDPGQVRLSAKYTLEEWRSGHLKSFLTI